MSSNHLNIIVALFFISAVALAGCSAHAEHREFNAQTPPLEVTASRFTNEYTKQVAEGEVRNVSGAGLEDVRLVVEWLSATDRTLDVTVEHLPDFAPNQTVRFRAEHPTNYRSVDVTHHQVRFQVADTRQVIPHRDSTGTQPGKPEGESGNHTADTGGSGGAPVAPTQTAPH